MRLLLPLVAALAVFLVACGGGGGDESSPAAPPTSSTGASPAAAATVEDRAEAEALLKTAALRLEDLPSGFTLDDERFATNEETAEEQKDNPYAPTLEDLNRFGRILSYEASYSQEMSTALLTSGGTLILQTTAAVYRDSEGASEGFEFVRERASDPGFADEFQQNFSSSSGVEVKSATISPMSFAQVGDDRLAFEIKITARSPQLDTDLEFVAQIVGVRRDRAIDSVTVIAVASPSPIQELEDLARTLDEHMKDALD
jgi:hypothetical protein